MGLNEKVDELKESIVSSVQKIVGIKSVEGKPEEGYPYGKGPAEALKCALDMAKGMGFKTVNVDNYIGYAEYGDGDDYVGVLGHLDVVPEGDGWKYPPFKAEIHDGKIYGRGTMDDKGAIIASLYGLCAIKDLKLPISKKVRIIFGTNEESGCKEIPYYLKREKPPVLGFTPDAEYPIINGEKGITIFDVVKDLKVKEKGSIELKYIKGGQRANMVPDYCEAVLEVEDKDTFMKLISNFVKRKGYNIKAEIKDGKIIVKSFGLGAHGSTPEIGKNAIMQMLSFLSEVEFEKSDCADYIDFFNKYVGMETDGKSFGVYMEDKVSGKLSFNVGTINMDENKISMSLNLRYPVTCSYDEMMEKFNARIKNTGIRVENMMHQPALYFPEDHKLIKILQKVYSDETGKEAKLLSIGGGTYAKDMPNMVAFGPIFEGEPDLDHQANECISIDSLILNAKIYAHAIYELAK